MRSVKFCLAVWSCLLWAASSAFAQSSVAGKWEIAVVTPQGQNSSTMTLKQEGDKLTGDLANLFGTTPIEGTVSADDVAVVANLNLQGMSLRIGLNGKVDGDTLKGNVKFGDFGEFPFTGTRAAGNAAPAAAIPPPPPAEPGSALDVTGKWDVVLSFEGVGEFPLAVDMKQDGSKLTATLNGPTGAMTLDGTITGSALRLELVVETPQGKLPIVLTGDVGADGLAGKATLQGIGEAKWKGTRAK